jgi:uridine phosphorylase
MARETTTPQITRHTVRPAHLRPHAPVAERVLLPGDPGRALRLAQVLIREPKMLNHNRGLWGYTGDAADGRPLTIQSTGIGGPSTAVVAEELIALGARRVVRVGTCAAMADGLALGTVLAVRRALAADGTSRALGAGESLLPDPRLLAALEEKSEAAGTVLCSDLFHSAAGAHDGAVAREMATAALLAVCARHGVPAAAALLVVEDGAGGRLDVEALHAAEERLGRAAFAALPAG